MANYCVELYCNYCGEYFASPSMGEKSNAISWASQNLTSTHWHNCASGAIGIAEIIAVIPEPMALAVAEPEIEASIDKEGEVK